jgi:molecular chaperone DnaK (HSP70)
MSKASYIIGIDLGTTNSTMAYTRLEQEGVVEQFAIAQVAQAGAQENQPSLPSFIYYALPEELAAKVAGIEWDSSRSFSIGSFARDRGAEVPSRVIASAKSWLCHNGIDRRAPILPLESDDVEQKMSPLEACAQILRHLQEAWDHHMPEAPFVEQHVLITVPASFDPSARQLVQEAAQSVSYPEIILLEEPQAAFYAWLNKHGDEWRKQLKVGDCVLVIDIGGGTTDFSLIGVEDEEGNLNLHRQAVGAHLLLGGDNIDLGLAHLAKQKLEEQGHAIDQWQLQSLVHQCRKAKERLMSDEAPKSVDITILGRGSRLIGNTLKTEVTQAEANQLLLEGFMPLLGPQERSPVERRSGIQQIGLPYVQDPRISCQLAKFLSMTGEADTSQMDQFTLPTAVLFNGGTMKSPALRNRLMTLLNQWAKALNKPPVRELPDADYDFAVSRGAVYYGLARLGRAIRIRGGTSRSYFVGVEEAAPAVPGINPPLRAVCIVPFGMEEGEERELPDQEFALVLGEPATFRFFSHATPKLSNGVEPVIGTTIRNWKQELSELHPIETVLDKTDGGGKTVRITLKSKVTELGMLELWCVDPEGKKWKLEFDIRDDKKLSKMH